MVIYIKGYSSRAYSNSSFWELHHKQIMSIPDIALVMIVLFDVLNVQICFQTSLMRTI